MYHPSRNYEDELDKKLIAMVQNFPGLYDSTVPDYRNPASTAQQWEIISRKLKMPSMFDEFLQSVHFSVFLIIQ